MEYPVLIVVSIVVVQDLSVVGVSPSDECMMFRVHDSSTMPTIMFVSVILLFLFGFMIVMAA